MEKTIQNIIELSEITCTRKEVDIDLLKDLQISMLNRPDLPAIAKAFDTIGNETRMKILFLLSEAGELCVCDLSDIIGHTVSAISHQLKKLKETGFVTTRKEPPTIYYSISDNSYLNVLVNLVKVGGLYG